MTLMKAQRRDSIDMILMLNWWRHAELRHHFMSGDRSPVWQEWLARQCGYIRCCRHCERRPKREWLTRTQIGGACVTLPSSGNSLADNRIRQADAGPAFVRRVVTPEYGWGPPLKR